MKETIISTIQWNRSDIKSLLEENGYEGTDQEIEKFLQGLDVRYFEEKCIESGWEILQNAVGEIFS